MNPWISDTIHYIKLLSKLKWDPKDLSSNQDHREMTPTV